MSSHRIRLYYPTDGVTADPGSGFHSWLKDWNTIFDTDTADEVSNSIPDTPRQPQDPTNEAYYRAELTYASSEDPLTILKDPYYALIDYCSWSRVGYHACDHGYDADDDGGCQWREENIREDPPVPEHVPTFL
jgi:hypothetical protein